MALNQTEIKRFLETYNKQHDSLFFTSKQQQEEWFQSIQTRAGFEPMLKEIMDEAERLMEKPIPPLTFSSFKLFSEKGSRKEYEKVYFSRRRRLTTFALAVLLEPNHQAYKEALQEIIWSICDEYTWCLPAHLHNSPEVAIEKNYSMKQQPPKYSIDLFAAETAFALSEILQLCIHQLDSLIQKRIHQGVFQRVIRPFHHGEFEWETATHNWASVCAGSIGASALYLMEDEEEMSVIIKRVLDTMEYYLDGFNDDGTCLEGYGYWEYGFGYYTYFADLLKKRTAGAIDLFQSEKVHQIALFQQKTFLDKNKVVNFSDAQPTAFIFLGLSHYLSGIYSDFNVPEKELRAALTDDHCSRWAPALRNVLWFDDKAVGHPWEAKTYFLKESQWFISRHSTTNGEYAFAAKGGHNDEPHNHNDLGQFILHGNGETFVKDLGSGLYTATYFSEERYSLICNGSQGHAAPIINGQHQQAGEANAASVLHVSTGGPVEEFEIDIAKAYEIATLKKLTRSFTWQKNELPCLILEDTYAFSDQPDCIVERFLTPVLDVQENQNGIVIGYDSKLQILFSHDQFDLQINRIQFLNHAGIKEENFALDFVVKQPETMCSIKLAFQFL